MDGTSQFEEWLTWCWTWPWRLMSLPGNTPIQSVQWLTQPILPGWAFDNSIHVTEENSSAPETERKIVSAHSYGQQLGRVMDAVEQLITERPKRAPKMQAFEDFEKLQREVHDIKTQATVERIRRTIGELAELKSRNADEYKRLETELRNIVQDNPAVSSAKS